MSSAVQFETLVEIYKRSVGRFASRELFGEKKDGAWSWRFAHDTCEGPLESSARCRLDARPAERLHSRVTLYFGRAHEEHRCERVRPGDWLWQFRPAKTAR